MLYTLPANQICFAERLRDIVSTTCQRLVETPLGCKWKVRVQWEPKFEMPSQLRNGGSLSEVDEAGVLSLQHESERNGRKLPVVDLGLPISLLQDFWTLFLLASSNYLAPPTRPPLLPWPPQPPPPSPLPFNHHRHTFPPFFIIVQLLHPHPRLRLHSTQYLPQPILPNRHPLPLRLYRHRDQKHQTQRDTQDWQNQPAEIDTYVDFVVVGGAGSGGGNVGAGAQSIGHCCLEVCEEGPDGGNVVRRRFIVEDIAEGAGGVAG